MADQQDHVETSILLDLITAISENPFGLSLEDEVLQLSLEEKTALLPKIGLAFTKIQSLYRFMEDSITADTRNREDDLRPTALREALSELPFLQPLCLQINVPKFDFHEVEGDAEAVGNDEVEAPSPSLNIVIRGDFPSSTGQEIQGNSGVGQNHSYSAPDQVSSQPGLRSPTPRDRGLETREDTDVVYELPTNYGMVLDSESHATEYSGTDVTNFPLSDDAQPRRQIILERPLGLIEGRGSIVEMNRRAFYEAFGYSIDGQDQTNASSRAASVITQTPVQVYDDWEDATNDGL